MEKIYYSSVRENRDWYYVEYQPPLPDFRFANLAVTFLNNIDANKAAEVMEKEGKIWLERYSIALMVSAFDNAGSLIHLGGVKPENHLICYKFFEGKNFVWSLLAEDELPADALDVEKLQIIYAGIPFKRNSDLKIEAKTKAKQIKIAKWMIFIWAVVVPAVVAILEWLSPEWVAILVLIFSLAKAAKEGLKLSGKWKRSESEIARQLEKNKMRHHHYHCEKNPEGFERLKMENFERELKIKILKESNSIVKN